MENNLIEKVPLNQDGFQCTEGKKSTTIVQTTKHRFILCREIKIMVCPVLWDKVQWDSD